MARIILPLAVIAALLFAPIYSFESNDPIGGEASASRTGQFFVGNTISCFMNQNYSIDGDCAPKGGNLGLAIFAGVFVSAVAAVLGIFGLLPFVGRLVSLVTTIAGIVAIAGIAYFCLNVMGEDAASVGWGSYLAGGGGLLTLISGLSGMRGN